MYSADLTAARNITSSHSGSCSLLAHIFRPAGNDTALVAAPWPGAKEAARLAEQVFSRVNGVEQVGFVWRDKATSHLAMAGGEICFNALRSAAEFHLSEQGANRLEIELCGQIYPVWREHNHVVTQICAPAKITRDFYPPLIAAELGCIAECALVDLGEITHLCCLVSEADLERLTVDEASLKALAARLFGRLGLDSAPACGLMLIAADTAPNCAPATKAQSATHAPNSTADALNLRLAPIVYVRDLQTLFFETACGSGSFAAFKSMQSSIQSARILQPSGLPIYLRADAQHALISSPVERLGCIDLAA